MAKKTLGLVSTLAVLGGLASVTARADQFHYNNIVIGTRAAGLGGAFGAVADDASGVYYNPAGLAFALSNDISGSANAFFTKETTYEDVIGGDAFVEESGGSVSPFFGGLQKLDRYVSGLVFAFGVYSTDSDLKDQDTIIENKKVGSSTIKYYHRTSNARASTFHAGAAVGMRITPNLAFGVGGSYFNADELVQEYQGSSISSVNDQGQTQWHFATSNVRDRLIVHGFEPTIGMQAALPANIALGLTIKKGLIASQQHQIGSESSDAFSDEAGAATIMGRGFAASLYSNGATNTKVEKPVGDWPMEARLGAAWFASPVFMWSFDAIYHSAVTNAENAPVYGGAARYEKEAVVDLATGVEYYVSPAFPLRFGLFTNNDARPDIEEGKPNAAAGQSCSNADWKKKYCLSGEHIDYLGGTLFIGWVQPNSQIAGGFVLQQGKGKARKLHDNPAVQDVKGSAYTFAFSATHNL